MKITIVGAGYVGISIAMLLAQNNEVVILDTDKSKIDFLNSKISPINDEEIQDFLTNKNLRYVATDNKQNAYDNSDFVVIATPTDYDSETNFFDTSSVESVIRDVAKIAPNSTIVIKSTVPVGFTAKIKDTLNFSKILFSPEFLREGNALYDNLYPSRIVMGGDPNPAKIFSKLLMEGSLKEHIEVIYTDSTEAEAIKLFSNAYLAMRVSFFNELDSYSEFYSLNTKNIIQGVGLDPRIGTHYNNPSFGYGGYCLPKDTKQLNANFKEVPNALIGAIVDSNSIRKDFIANSILKKNPKTVGVYRLLMKSGSDNFRSAAINGVIDRLKIKGVQIIIFEPSIDEVNILKSKVINDLEVFKNKSDLIIANRTTNDLEDVNYKVYTRDIFNVD